MEKDSILTRGKRNISKGLVASYKEISARGWLLDIMRSIEKLGKRDFTLDDMYAFEKELSLIHPDNKHVKDKIRQQLQVLRDKGYLDFISRGYYHLT